MPARPDPAKEEKLRKLWATDLNLEAIAIRMGMQKSSVQKLGRRLNLPNKPNTLRWS